jgi:acyl carrier protein
MATKPTIERLAVCINSVIDQGKGVIKPEATFAKMGFDSIDCLELMVAVEVEFTISIPDEEAEDLKTVAEAVGYIEGVIALNRK